MARVCMYLVVALLLTVAPVAAQPTTTIGPAAVLLYVNAQIVQPNGDIVLLLGGGRQVTVSAKDIDQEMSTLITEVGRQGLAQAATEAHDQFFAPVGAVANQGDPRYYTPPTDPNLNPESSGFRYGGYARPFVYAPEAPITVPALCQADWPGDFRMQKFCAERYAQGQAGLDSRRMSSTNEQLIRGNCRQLWPGDPRMQNYCESRQLEALRQIQGR